MSSKDSSKESQMELRIVTRKLKALLANFDNMAAFVSRYNSDLNNVNQLRTRLDELSTMTNKYEEYQSEVERLDEKSEDERIAERINFTERLCDTKAILMQIIDQEIKKAEEVASPSFTSTTSTRDSNFMKLPAIEVPKFAGDWQQWTSFIESYNAMFHHNTSLAPIHQFHYLRSCLVGQASEVIKSIPTTGENYLQAYETLINRYENKGAIIQSHIRALFDTPKIAVASTTELQQLHHHITSNINALRALEQPVNSWDAWLVTLICTRLDSMTVGEWHLQYNKKELPTFTIIERFLFNRIAAYEAGDIGIMPVPVRKYAPKLVSNKPFEKRTLIVQQQHRISISKCPVCEGNHKIYGCNEFNAMTVPERRDTVSKCRLCFNCLSRGHLVKDCTGSSCLKCAKRHNTKLHLIFKNSNQEENQSNNETEDAEGHNQAVLYVHQQIPKQVAAEVVLLATAIVTIVDKNGKKQECRAILDSGSQISLVTKKCAQALQLTPQNNKVTIMGIGEKETSSSKLHPVVVSSRFNNFEALVTLHVLPKITNDLPTEVINVNNLNIPHDIVHHLADPFYAKPQPVDILLGAEIFFELLQKERRSIGSTTFAQNTRLGWIITGTAPSGQRFIEKLSRTPMRFQINQSSALSLFSTKAMLQYEEERKAEELFLSTHHRDDSGRFVVSLPFSQDPLVLGDSKAMAQRRFINLEKRFVKDSNFATAYHKFMAEYIALNHMVEVSSSDTSQPTYYLPHHGVFRAESLTTKLRVVFDGSAPARCGQSLNDILIRGPKVQPDLISIVLRFRIHNVVLTADITKMYRQILVDPKDCNLQRIYYRTDPSKALQIYKLLTVTYGTKAASFLATRCLKEMAKNATSAVAERAIEQDFYVDDLLTGSDSVEKTFSLYQDVSATLDKAHLPLRKWCSNSKALMNQMPSAKDDPTYLLSLDDDETICTLGMKWQPSIDSFRFSFKNWEPPSPMTKRTMLSDIHKIYDPVGLLTPVLIKGKIFMQNLWALKVNWDSELSADIQTRWIRFYIGLKALEQLRIPRQVLCPSYTHLELHGFCDASQDAFGACIYMRSLSSSGAFHVKLMSSKSRVAPMHQTTIPRLELCGALLLAELYFLVSNELKLLDIHFEAKNVNFWTDSSIVLSWINCTIPLKSYVSNRVAQILDTTQASSWFHVQTSQNPADLITRGIESSALEHCILW